jgi:glycosyltransferase involved in cell wall biosynthesis
MRRVVASVLGSIFSRLPSRLTAYRRSSTMAGEQAGRAKAASRPIRILLVGEARSIHAARFLLLLREIGYEARLFHADQGGFFEDQNLNDATVYMPYFDDFYYSGRNRLLITHPIPFEIKPRSRSQAPLRALAKYFGDKRHRVYDLMRVLRSFAPDLVISARMQSEGYLVAEAKVLMGDSFTVPWIHFLWGTDIEFFGKDEGFRQQHLLPIRRVLSLCDYVLTDTQRDADQAPAFGFRGEHLAVFPAHGGFDPEWLASVRLPVQAPRDVIFVKGREGSYVGRAMNIFAALERLGPRLAGYRVVVLLATPNVRAILPGLTERCGIPFEFVEYVPYDELMRLYGRSRIAISATTVDGMPSFLAEAMAMGALPIHSDMASIREWIDDGDNGLLFPVDDIDALERAIARGLSDDELFNRAVRRNQQLVDARLNRDMLRDGFAAMIDKVLRRRQTVDMSPSR